MRDRRDVGGDLKMTLCSAYPPECCPSALYWSTLIGDAHASGLVCNLP